MLDARACLRHRRSGLDATPLPPPSLSPSPSLSPFVPPSLSLSLSLSLFGVSVLSPSLSLSLSVCASLATLHFIFVFIPCHLVRCKIADRHGCVCVCVCV